jgi:hypothetical protein
MAAKKVTRYVHVTHPDTQAVTVLAPGDEVPSWAEVDNDKAFEEDTVSNDDNDNEPVVMDASGQVPSVDYSDMDKDDLQAEVDRRNETRDESNRIDPGGSTAAKLKKALEADDEARQAGDLNTGPAGV